MRGADYVIKRAGFALLTIFIAITVNFFLFRVLPGNAVSDLARVPHATTQLRHALTVAHRACVLESGRRALEGPARELLGDERLRQAYLGL